MAEKSTYYWCIVPCCTSSSISTPNKIFIHVPKDAKMRKLWLQAARRDPKKISKNTAIYCCEDHFDLPNDMENWQRFKLMKGNVKKNMKKGIVPHRFVCQADRKRAASPLVQRQAFMKRQRIDVLGELHQNVLSSNDKPRSGNDPNLARELIETVQDTAIEQSIVDPRYQHVSTQINIKPHVRSKYVQVKPSTTNSASSPFKTTINVSTSPITHKNIHKGRFSKVELLKQISISSTSTSDSTETYKASTDSESDALSTKYQTELLKSTSTSRTIEIIGRNPRHYIGVPENCYFIVKLISETTSISINNILLVLMKIRLNKTFVELADDFGISSSHASKIFSMYVSVIAKYLKCFICWPKPETIIQNLPLAFRARYSKVQSIIDALEIEIQKPSDPIKQALTWSEYKKCNTIKYLISSTPDGIINFISQGFSGRITDTLLTEECSYLNILPPGASVMADRGFKHVEHLLTALGCKLIRPPSVVNKQKLSKQEVIETKRIASLRIHIERTIRRIREFKFLKPHSCIHNKHIPLTDNVINIAAALVNLQGPLVRK